MRRPRLHVPGACYHVTLRGNHREDIFFSEADRCLLDRYVAAARERVSVRIHAYCWMTNHIHLLVQVSDVPLGAFMQRIGARYARAVHSRIPTTGHLFQNRYHALLVDVDRYFLQLLRYIHLNPVRAGLVADPAEYAWSSHRAYLGLAQIDWLTTEFGLGLFGTAVGRARGSYRDFVMQGVAATSDMQLPPTLENEPRVLGDEDFARSLQQPVPHIKKVVDLDSIIETTCAELGVTLSEVASPSQLRRLARARGTIAARALAAGVASLSEIALRLNRSASALARAAERYRSG